MADDPNWLLDTNRADGGIVVNMIPADMPEYSPGSTLTVPLTFWSDSSLTDSLQTRYEAARDYLDYGGRVTVTQAINGTPHFRERIPSDADVDSIVVDLVPQTSADWNYTPGFWAVITGGDDVSQYVDDFARLDVQMTVIAKADDYADRTALKNDLAGAVV